ncbi:MAG: DUF1257 domain-containing protein [bacterium]
MSHFTTIETQVRDIPALREACRELGVELLENAIARGYAANTHKGDLVIRLKGPYDVALNRQPDGSYGLTTDWWGGHVERELGTGFGKLLQLYGVYRAQQEARRKGYTTRRQQLGDGSIKLTIGGI